MLNRIALGFVFGLMAAVGTIAGLWGFQLLSHHMLNLPLPAITYNPAVILVGTAASSSIGALIAFLTYFRQIARALEVLAAWGLAIAALWLGSEMFAAIGFWRTWHADKFVFFIVSFVMIAPLFLPFYVHTNK